MEGPYGAKKLWHLNPRFSISGHFQLKPANVENNKELKLKLNVSIIDQYEREHKHLPVHYVFNADGKYWYLAP